MTKFNVLNWDFNSDSIVYYDVMPYLYNCFKEEKRRKGLKRKDITLQWLTDFIDQKARYKFWARCEYEIIISGWPQERNKCKIDIYSQIEANLDTIAKLIYNDIK